VGILLGSFIFLFGKEKGRESQHADIPCHFLKKIRMDKKKKNK